MISEEAYQLLDPGIRETVRLLHSWGFETTDSGEGVTQRLPESPDDWLHLPHVFMRVNDSRTLVALAGKLRDLLLLEGVRIKSQYEVVANDVPDTGWIEALYDPVDDMALLCLFRVHDAMLGSLER